MIMSGHFSLSPQAVNLLFATLAQQPDCALWICALDYSQQLYLSPGFTDIWQRDTSLIYENQSALQETVDAGDLNEALVYVAKRQEEIKQGRLITPEQTLFYRIWRPDGKLRWIKDRSFIVHNQAGEPAAHAGVSYSISEDEWMQSRAKQQDIEMQGLPMATDFVHIIEKACTPYIRPPEEPISLSKSLILHVEDRPYQISGRELECLLHTIVGASAKQIAKQLGISPRTVETYIEQLKIKFECRSKLALIGKLANNKLILKLLNQYNM